MVEEEEEEVEEETEELLLPEDRDDEVSTGQRGAAEVEAVRKGRREGSDGEK